MHAVKVVRFFCYFHQRTPLHVAAEAGHVDTVEYLVNNGADINFKDDDGVNIIYCCFILQSYWSVAMKYISIFHS